MFQSIHVPLAKGGGGWTEQVVPKKTTNCFAIREMGIALSSPCLLLPKVFRTVPLTLFVFTLGIYVGHSGAVMGVDGETKRQLGRVQGSLRLYPELLHARHAPRTGASLFLY